MELNDILDGLAAALEIEREAGVRTVEIDRALLAEGRTGDEKSETRAETKRRETGAASGDARRETRAETARRETRDASGDARRETRIVFLHDRALSPGAVTMMAKVVTAMHETPETAPILFTGTLPKARAVVVLGHGALRKWFPGTAGAPGQWIRPDGLANVLVTYSPEFILRRGLSPDAVQKLKREMWTSLKQVLQRLATKP